MDNLASAVESLRSNLAGAQKVLVGIGEEWDTTKKSWTESEVMAAYEALYKLIEGKDYFIITTNTDAKIFDGPFDAARITAPCGNETWKQCSKSCVRDIWEEGEIPDGMCPHCGAPLTGNTIRADHYIEEGYLPGWRAYTEWLAGTLNRELTILELGVGFRTPTVVRWPFERTAFINEKAAMFRVNERFALVSEEIRDKVTVIPQNSLIFLESLV